MMKTSLKKERALSPALLRTAAIVAVALAGTAARADLISSLDTGAGLYAANNGDTDIATLTDPNWTVSLLSSTGTPPGGVPTGAAYLVPNNIGFPFGYWLPNDATSSWITYSNPVQLGGDTTGDTFQYQLTFFTPDGGAVGISWLSDNTNELFLNGVLVGSNPGQFGAWNEPIDVTLAPDSVDTVDLDVYNTPQSYGNPTGARVRVYRQCRSRSAAGGSRRIFAAHQSGLLGPPLLRWPIA